MPPDQEVRPSSKPTAPQPAIGQAFNPWHKTCGFYPPDIVGRNRELKLTDGQKRLYERGVQWANKKGVFWHDFPTIAEALGESVRTAKRNMTALEDKRLIAHRRRRRRSNVYHFLWHEIFAGAVQSAAHRQEGTETPLGRQSITALEVPAMAHQGSNLEVPSVVRNIPLKVPFETFSTAKQTDFKELAGLELLPTTELLPRIPDLGSASVLSLEKAPSSSSTPTAAETQRQVEVGTGDDDFLSKSTTASADPGSKEHQIMSAKSDSVEPSELASDADPLIERQPLPEVFLLSVAKRLRDASGFDEAPDLACARSIAECFRGKGRVVLADWLWSAAERDLGGKTKAQGPFRYGLFMRDAAASAAIGKFPLSKRVDFEIRMREAAEARAKATRAQQQAEAEHAELMATPLPVDEAVKILRAERNVRDNQDLTPAIIRSIRAERQTISPMELAAAVACWRPCVKCGSRGLVGRDLDGTLAYCNCPVGRQSRREHGDAWPSQRITQAQHTEAELKAGQASLNERMRQLRRDEGGQPSAAAEQPKNVKSPDTLDFQVVCYRCKCGAEICQYADRVTGTCTCGRAKPTGSSFRRTSRDCPGAWLEAS